MTTVRYQGKALTDIFKIIIMISFYSPQMVATVNTTKYTTENDLTKKKKTNKQTNGMFFVFSIFRIITFVCGVCVFLLPFLA